MHRSLRRYLQSLLLTGIGIGGLANAGTVVEDITFHSDGLKLYAEVFLPERGENLPGIVLIQGAGESGTANRWARRFATTFAECGFAVLLPDKRGVGRSEGNWRIAGFEALAGDAVASLRALENHARVRRGDVGLMGLSQGGHVAPLAAVAVDGIPFVINVVGSMTVMEEQLYHELKNTYRQHGLDEQSIARLQTMTRRSFDYIRDESSWDDYLAIRTEIANGPLARGAQSWPDKQDDPYWVFWRQIFDFDPIPLWRQLVEERNVPSLVLLGAEDEYDNVPVAASRERSEPLLDDGDFTLRVYPDSGHALYAPGTTELRPDMIEQTDRWIKAALARRDRPAAP